MPQGHSRTKLQVYRFRMEHLFGEGALRSRPEAGSMDKLMARHHGEILGTVLEDEVLTLGETPGGLQSAEGDEGIQKALAQAAATVPAPQIRILRMQGQRAITGACSHEL